MPVAPPVPVIPPVAVPPLLTAPPELPVTGIVVPPPAPPAPLAPPADGAPPELTGGFSGAALFTTMPFCTDVLSSQPEAPAEHNADIGKSRT